MRIFRSAVPRLGGRGVPTSARFADYGRLADTLAVPRKAGARPAPPETAASRPQRNRATITVRRTVIVARLVIDSSPVDTLLIETHGQLVSDFLAEHGIEAPQARHTASDREHFKCLESGDHRQQGRIRV